MDINRKQINEIAAKCQTPDTCFQPPEGGTLVVHRDGVVAYNQRVGDCDITVEPGKIDRVVIESNGWCRYYELNGGQVQSSILSRGSGDEPEAVRNADAVIASALACCERAIETVAADASVPQKPALEAKMGELGKKV